MRNHEIKRNSDRPQNAVTTSLIRWTKLLKDIEKEDAATGTNDSCEIRDSRKWRNDGEFESDCGKQKNKSQLDSVLAFDMIDSESREDKTGNEELTKHKTDTWK